MASSSNIVVTTEDVAGLFTPNVLPKADGYRVLIPVPAMDPNGFTPDGGRDGLSGLLGVESRDGKSIAIFCNPKDSVENAQSRQRLPLDGAGWLIFPFAARETADDMLGRLHEGGLLPENGRPGTVADLDRLLKAVRDYYQSRGMTPDMYNTDAGYLNKKMELLPGQPGDAAAVYVKRRIPVALILLRAPPDSTIEFHSSGAFVQGGAQYGQGSIVLIHELGETRKMAPDYACKQYVHLDDAPLDLGRLPAFDADSLKAPRPRTWSGPKAAPGGR